MNWAQLQAILWLRWRLTRNQFARAGSLNVVLSIVLSALLLLGAAAFGLGGFFLGAYAGAKAPPRVLLYIWDGAVIGFLLFWLSGLMVELQRSESIDLTKLLHLPVTLNQVFVFNYAASHFTPSIVLFMPAMLGLCAGLVLGAGPGFYFHGHRLDLLSARLAVGADGQQTAAARHPRLDYHRSRSHRPTPKSGFQLFLFPQAPPVKPAGKPTAPKCLRARGQ